MRYLELSVFRGTPLCGSKASSTITFSSSFSSSSMLSTLSSLFVFGNDMGVIIDSGLYARPLCLFRSENHLSLSFSSKSSKAWQWCLPSRLQQIFIRSSTTLSSTRYIRQMRASVNNQWKRRNFNTTKKSRRKQLKRDLRLQWRGQWTFGNTSLRGWLLRLT